MKKVEINGFTYNLEKNYKEAFDEDSFKELCTEYFNDFDYIFGDYSYDKLRLKGFYEENSKNVKKINNIKTLDDYIKNYCSFECRYFLLHKEKSRSK